MNELFRWGRHFPDRPGHDNVIRDRILETDGTWNDDSTPNIAFINKFTTCVSEENTEIERQLLEVR